MSLIVLEGFDHQNNGTDLIANESTTGCTWDWSILTLSGGTLLVPGSGPNSKALSLVTSGIFGGTKLTPFVGSMVIVGFGVRVPIAGNILIGFWDSVTQNPLSGSMQLSVLLEGSTGIISIYRGSTSGTLLYASATNQFPRNKYFYLELKPKIDSSIGSIDIRIKSVPYLSLTGLNTQSGGTVDVDGIFFGGGGNGRIDHLYIADTIVGIGANPFDDFQGDPTFPQGLRVFTRFSTANGVDIDFSPLTGTNALEVQEHKMDSDTSYNYDIGTIGDQDLFEATSIPKNLTPLACQIRGSYRETGTGRLWGIVNKLRSGTTQFQGSPVNIFPTYVYQSDVYPENPDGNIPWDKSSIDSSQIGYQIVSSTPPTPPLRVVGFNNMGTAVDHSIIDVFLNLTTTDAAVIRVQVILNAEGAPAQDQFPGIVTSVDILGLGLSFTRRVRVDGQGPGFLFGNTFVDSEVWWVYCPSPLSAEPIRVRVNSELSWITVTAIGISGVNPIFPWDTNSSLPKIGTNLSGTTTLTPQVTGVSTDNPNSAILFSWDEFTFVGLLGGPPGFTRGPGGQNVNVFIGLITEDYTFYDIVSSQLVNETLVGSPALPSWIVIADALQAA